jgi:hypothetical protein
LLGLCPESLRNPNEIVCTVHEFGFRTDKNGCFSDVLPIL